MLSDNVTVYIPTFKHTKRIIKVYENWLESLTFEK